MAFGKGWKIVERINCPAEKIRFQKKIKGSKFIASVAPAYSPVEGEEFLERIKKEFWDATHNVFAYQIAVGEEAEEKASDDGEPTGSSGPPVLQAIKGSGLTNTIVVVTRYFGGTKLGIGGLIRAYGDTAAQALEETPRKELRLLVYGRVRVPYDFFGNITGFLEKEGVRIEKIDYDNEGGSIFFWIEPGKIEFFEFQFKELGRGKCPLEIIKKEYRLC